MFRFLFDIKRTAVLLCCAPLFLGAAQEIFRLVEGSFTAADLSRVLPAGLDGKLADDPKQAALLKSYRSALVVLVSLPDRCPEAAADRPGDDPLLKACEGRAARLADLKLLFRSYTDLQQLPNAARVNAYLPPERLREADLSKYVDKFKELVRDEFQLKEMARRTASLEGRPLREHLAEWAQKLKKHQGTEGANEDFCRLQEAMIFRHQFHLDHQPDDFLRRARTKFEAEAPDPAFAEELRSSVANLEQKLRDLPPASDESEVKYLRTVFDAWLRERKRVRELFDLRERAVALAARARPGDDAKSLLDELGALAGEKEFEPYRPLVHGAARRFLEGFLPRRLDPEPQVMLRDGNGDLQGPVPRGHVTIHHDGEKSNERVKVSLEDRKSQEAFNEFTTDWAALVRKLNARISAPVLDKSGKQRYELFEAILLPTPRARAHHEYNQARASDWRWGRASLAALIERLEAPGPRPPRRLHEEMDQDLWARIRWLRDNFPEALTQRGP